MNTNTIKIKYLFKKKKQHFIKKIEKIINIKV